MELKDEREVEVTREKLRSLETRYQAASQDPGDDAHTQELTLRSLKRLINQMKEEIARFEAQIPACSSVSLHRHEELSAPESGRRKGGHCAIDPHSCHVDGCVLRGNVAVPLVVVRAEYPPTA